MIKLKIIHSITMLLLTMSVSAQNYNKQESLDALKQTMQGAIIHYYEGGPCLEGGSRFSEAVNITVESVKYEYSHVIVVYQVARNNNRPSKHVKRINMTNNFASIDNGIFEVYWAADNIINNCDQTLDLALAFSPNAKAAQNRCLNILRYMRKFAEKDPFSSD